MVYPWHKAHVDEAHRHGLKVLKHCCGHVWPVIDELADIYDALRGHPGQRPAWTSASSRQRVGDRLCLWGGIWHEHIILGSAEDIRNDARYAFDARRARRRLHHGLDPLAGGGRQGARTSWR